MKPSEHPQPNGRDPLEDRLRRTTFRPLAPAWRDEILAAAQTSAAVEATRRSPAGRPQVEAEPSSWPHLLLRWLRGIPTEWSAAAALWLLIVAINSVSSSSNSNTPTDSSSLAQDSAEQREESVQIALAYRRQLLSELQGNDASDDLPLRPRPEADRPKRQLNFLGTNGPAATSA